MQTVGYPAGQMYLHDENPSMVLTRVTPASLILCPDGSEISCKKFDAEGKKKDFKQI